ncbi:MAG: YgcG family protein [Deltaproteobacteria bacterium]
MKQIGARWALIWLAAIFLWPAAPVAANALEVPALKARVNDYAQMISPATERRLEQSLQDFEASQSTQIAVLTIPSLQGESIENFSIRVAESWKIGQKEKDNGAILVIARKDRKLRIEVGYGLEGRLTDLIAGRIIRQIITPAFREGNYDLGILNGVQAMMSAVEGEFEAVPAHAPTERTGGFSGFLIPLIVFAFLIIQLGRVARMLGIVAGGVMLPIFSGLFFNSGLLLLLLMIPAGLLAGFVLSLIGAALQSTSRGRGGIYFGGFGGGSGGGGFGGFSGGGGGFGGGGASGSW